MKTNWRQRLREQLGHTAGVSLQVRFFRLICLTTFGLCLGLIMPMNFFQNLPAIVNVTNVILGLLGGWFYWLSLRGQNHVGIFFLFLVASLNPIWFYNAGSVGSVGLYFFPLIIYPIVMYRGPARVLLALGVMLNSSALVLIEYYWPALTTPFQHETDRVIDLTTGLFTSGLALAVLFRLIMVTYERKQERLGISERNYREIFNATSDALIIRDLEGRTIDVNERMCVLYRCDRARALTLTIGDVSAGDPYGETAANEYISRAQVDGPQVFRWHSRRCTGELFWSEVALRVGEIAGSTRIISSLRDISSRVETEEALQTQEERLRLAMAAAKQGWFDINVQTGQGRASAEFARMIGLPPEDFDANVETWLDGIHPDDLNMVRTAYQNCVANGGANRVEYRRRTMSGAWIWLRSMGRIVATDDQGRSLRMLGTHMDITERKTMEARTRHNQRLEAVATLAGGVAHDLNNILTPMLMVRDLLSDKLDSRTDRDLLASMEHNARRGATIVRQLLTFSRSLEAERTPVDPVEFVLTAAEETRTDCPSSITVTVESAPKLWPVRINRPQMRQVMQNLCANAREAMPQGGTLTIRAENIQLEQTPSTLNPWGKGGSFVLITVSDTGCGIAPENLGRIFDPFYTTKEIGQGSGLGLSTAHGIVSGHGGNLTVTSATGLGTSFMVHLPANADNIAAG